MRYAVKSPILSAFSQLENESWVVNYAQLSAHARLNVPELTKMITIHTAFQLQPNQSIVIWSFALQGRPCESPAAQPFIECVRSRFQDNGFEFCRDGHNRITFWWSTEKKELFSTTDPQTVIAELITLLWHGMSFTEPCINTLLECDVCHRYSKYLFRKLPSPQLLADYCSLGFFENVPHFNA